MAKPFTFLFLLFSFLLPVHAGQAPCHYCAQRVQLQVLPTPGNGVFTIVYKSDVKGPVNLSVTDATGKYVYLKTVRDFGGELKEVFDLSGLPKGIYIVEAERDNSREMKKIIHQ